MRGHRLGLQARGAEVRRHFDIADAADFGTAMERKSHIVPCPRANGRWHAPRRTSRPRYHGSHQLAPAPDFTWYPVARQIVALNDPSGVAASDPNRSAPFLILAATSAGRPAIIAGSSGRTKSRM